VKAIDAATSSPSAPITGATAAIAELPQIELPHATRMARRFDRPSSRPITKLSRIAPATMPRIETSKGQPAARTVVALSDAPSSTTATSSTNLALNSTPRFHLGPGIQTVRTAVPTRIASTSASIQARPAAANSTRCSR
jgi:hypothetical protein